MKSGMPPFVGNEDPLTERILGVFYQFANELGFGFLDKLEVGLVLNFGPSARIQRLEFRNSNKAEPAGTH